MSESALLRSILKTPNTLGANMASRRTRPALRIETQGTELTELQCKCGVQFTNDSVYCRKCGELSPHVDLTSPPAEVRNEPILTKWWDKTKVWNVKVSNNGFCARRNLLETAAGGVVLGNGRMQNHCGSHILNPGFFYSFIITGIDDENFTEKPPKEGYSLSKYVKDMSLAFGVSRVPPSHDSCLCPTYAYEIPGVVLVGYGPHVVDKIWLRQSGRWTTKDLKLNDEVGFLIARDGEVTVYVNRVQKLRFASSLAADMEDYEGRRNFWPIVDLHGRVYSVKLMPRRPPPNFPKELRQRLKPEASWENKEKK